MRLPTFVLVHGFQHNGASWALLVEALARREAPAIAVDLPCEDPSAGLRAYADAVLARAELLEDVVVVGHSLGGLTATLVASERPVRELILLCASIPEVGRSLNDVIASEPEMAPSFIREHPHKLTLDDDGTYPPLPADYARELFYHDCSVPCQAWAVTQLRRQGTLPFTEVWPLTEWPDVPTRAIYTLDDHAASAEWSSRVLQQRLGIPTELVPGGHSPFLSRPDELAELFLRPYADAASRVNEMRGISTT